MPARYTTLGRIKEARAAAGGGYESAIQITGTPVVSSVVDNGSTLTISGSNFGEKAVAAPVLADYVDTSYEYGVENTFNASLASDTQPANTEAGRIWDQIVSGQLTAGGRTGSQSRMYRLFGETASLRQPFDYEQNERQSGNRKMYFAAWVKYKQNSFLHRMTTDEYTTGTFVPDEVISINSGEFLGYYAGDVAEPNNYVHSFCFDSSSEVVPSDSQLYGKTLIGQTSGATLTFPSEVNWRSVYSGDLPFVRTRGPKVARIWDDTDGNGLRSSYAADDAYLTIGDIATSVDYQMRSVWRFFEIEMDLTTDGYWGHFIDRVARADVSQDLSAIGDPTSSISVEQFGIEGGLTSEQETDVAEIYFDKTRQRIYLGDASTFSACTHVELQRPTAWADDGITAAKNLGTLSGGWIYVVGPTGLVNETGVSI